jgi:glycosyltransferase involved in cell wall biosynthesis
MKYDITSKEYKELPRLLVVTSNPPSIVTAVGITLRNLLREYPRERLTIISGAYETKDLLMRGHAGGLLDVPHILVHPWRLNVRGVYRLVRWLSVIKIIVQTTITAMRRASRDTTILAVPYGGRFGSELFVGAYFAHRLSGAPLVIYEMDEWRASLVGALNERIPLVLERLFHRRIVREARTVWAMSDQMAEEFRARFGIKAKVLPGCVEVDKFARGRHGERAHSDEFRLLFTGSVSTPQAGAIRGVLRTIQSDPDDRTLLVIYSSQSVDELARQGITGPKLRIERSVAPEKMPDILATADALLLPFSFDEQQRPIVSTSLPSKIADYLASGVPVLVHAPPDATITRMAISEGWAEVVDEPSMERLADALRRLANDKSLRKRLVANALRIARARHDLATRRAEFIASIK